MENLKNYNEIVLEVMEAKKVFGTKEVTGGVNGYPSPETGIFFPINSEKDKDMFEKICPNLNDICDLHLFHQRDGWNHWEDKGMKFEPMKFEEIFDDWGDNNTYIKIDKNNIDNIIKEEVWFGYSSVLDFCRNEGFDREDIERRVKAAKTIRKDIEEAVSGSSSYILYEGFCHYYGGGGEEFEENIYGYYHDTHSYQMGIYLEYDENIEVIGQGGEEEEVSLREVL